MQRQDGSDALEEEHEVMWLVEDEGEEEQADTPQAPMSAEQKVEALDLELQRTKDELAAVRKELAKKTVELMRKDKEQTAAAEKLEKLEKVTEAPPAVSAETERQMQLLNGQVLQLEGMLAQREEELEEARRLLTSQKRALREAAALQGEREAADMAAAEASQAVVGAAVEEEMERLASELAETKTRSELALRERENEIRQLKRKLAAIDQEHKQALTQHEANLAEAWQGEVSKVQEQFQERLQQYESEVSRLRTQLQDARSHTDGAELINELAMLNKSKIQVQREFEAFKEMATQAARKNREEVAKLLEENAALHSKLASRKQAELLGAGVNLSRLGPSKSVDVLSDQPPPGASSYSAYAYKALESYMPDLVKRMEQNQRQVLPCVIIGGVIFLMIMVAVVRAAASTRAQHSGALCFLAKLGIRIGKGCGPVGQDPSQELAHLLDLPKRHHDVDLNTIAALPAAQTKANTTAASLSVSTTKTEQQAIILQPEHVDTVEAAGTQTAAGSKAGSGQAALPAGDVQTASAATEGDRGGAASAAGSSNDGQPAAQASQGGDSDAPQQAADGTKTARSGHRRMLMRWRNTEHQRYHTGRHRWQT